KANVVGMAFGYKTISNSNTSEPCFKILVKEKVNPSKLNPSDLIPETYEGFKTDIIETGELSYASLSEKCLPLQYGYSIGPSTTKKVGTAGCLVKDSCNNYYILGCNHVFSNFQTLPIGTPILQPGVNDGGKYPNDLIAILHKNIPIIHSIGAPIVINYVDCAIAKLINPRLTTKNIALVGNIKGVRDASINLNVKKVGRTTELTTGIIMALDAVISMEDSNGNSQIFADQIITTHMNSEGDSGSILLDDNNNAIGLLFGNGESISIVNPIKLVLKALNVTLVV
ncbi:MAG: serine protease, partial [Sarcina sp.]